MFEDIPRPGLWKRLLVGAVLVIFAAAGATAVAAFREIDKVVEALELGPELKLGKELAKTDPGKPQTLMILGSDRRPNKNLEGAGGRGDARSDTIMLVRLDPDKEAIALMSLPRDLKVEIPGGHRQDQRGLRLRRSEAHAPDREAARRALDQPRDQRGLRRLLAGRERRRLRLRRHRPALLQRQCRVHLHRRPGRLPASVRAPGPAVRALPPRGQRPRALCPTAGLPAPGQAAGGHVGADRQARPLGAHLRPQHHHRQRPADALRGSPPAQAGPGHGRPAGP